MFEHLDPGQITLSAGAVMLSVITLILRGILVPGKIYNRLVEDNQKKDAVIDRLSVSYERLSRRLSNNKARE